MVALLCVAGCGAVETSDPVVARIGTEHITLDEFMDGYRRHLLETGQQDAEAVRRSFLEGIVNQKLLVLHALDTGNYDEGFEEQAADRIRKKLLLEAYAAEVTYKGLDVTESDMREMFVRMNTSITARHLYSRTLDGARSLKARLDTGASFDELAREVFSDPTLAENGGSVGTFGFDEMDPAFEEAAYALDIGTVSDPVRTAQGYSIIRVDDRFTNPLVTESEFATRRHGVEQYVRQRKRVAARAEHLRSITEALSVQFAEPTTTRLLYQIVGSPFGLEDERVSIASDTLVTFSSSTTGASSWTVDEFREFALVTSQEQRAAVEDRYSLEQFVEGLVAREEMVRRAVGMGLDRTEIFDSAMQAAKEDWIYERFRESFRNAIVIERDSVESYYERFSDEFTIPEKVRVWEVLLETKREADSIFALTPKVAFEELAREHSIRQDAASSGGDLGYATRDQLGLLADAVFEAHEGEILPPIEIAGRYAVLKIGDRLPPRPAGLEEVYPEIESRIRRFVERHELVAEVTPLARKATLNIDWGSVYSAPLSPNVEGKRTSDGG